MRPYTYTIAPDLLLAVHSNRPLKLLSHVLGDETPSQAAPALTLDLSGNGETSGRDTTVRGVYKALPWSCSLSPRAEGSWSIAFRSVLYREYLALHIALLPALRRLLLERGVALSIGAAFARDGGATMIAGRTGRGKTSLLLGAIERGASFLGDEYAGLHESGDVTPVVRSLALRRATLSLAPETFARLRTNRRLALRIAQAATSLTRGFLQPLVHIPPGELIDRAPAGTGHLQRFFWLEAGDDVRCERMPSGEASAQLATLQQLHDVAYGDLGTFIGGAPYPDRWHEIASRALEGVSCYRLSLPARGNIPNEALNFVLEPDA